MAPLDEAWKLQGLKLNEWSAIIFGATGFVFGSIALVFSFLANNRAVNTQRKQEEDSIRQRRMDQVSMLTQAEATLISEKRALDSLAFDAISVGNSEIAKLAEDSVKNVQDLLGVVKEISVNLVLDLPPRERWPELEASFEVVSLKMKKLDVDLRTQKTGDFIDHARRTLALAASAKQ